MVLTKLLFVIFSFHGLLKPEDLQTQNTSLAGNHNEITLRIMKELISNQFAFQPLDLSSTFFDFLVSFFAKFHVSSSKERLKHWRLHFKFPKHLASSAFLGQHFLKTCQFKVLVYVRLHVMFTIDSEVSVLLQWRSLILFEISENSDFPILLFLQAQQCW